MKRIKPIWKRVFLVTLLYSSIATAGWSATLDLGITPAPVGGTSIAALFVRDAADVESFSLTLNFSSGNTLDIVSAGWFRRNSYYPSVPFGAVPQVDKNHVQTSDQYGKIFFNGFSPADNSGSVGVVTFDVVGNGSQVLSLSGKYLSRSSGLVEDFPTQTATFMIGSYPDPIPGDINNDDDINLEDAVLALQILTGITPQKMIFKEADVNSDMRIGIEEIIYILQQSMQ